jgi:hypothetical protein
MVKEDTLIRMARHLGPTHMIEVTGTRTTRCRQRTPMHKIRASAQAILMGVRQIRIVNPGGFWLGENTLLPIASVSLGNKDQA